MRLRASQTLTLEPHLPDALTPLRDLAYNLYWSWNTDAAALFERIDRDLWRETRRNPVALLQRADSETFAGLAADEGFIAHLDRVNGAFAAYLERRPLVSLPGADEKQPVAYFSLEFALTESLPNYSGGLGVLAGDHLKSASDLGLPLVGLGLLYHEGYFLQHLGEDGWQREDYQEIDITQQPIEAVAGKDGRHLTVQVPLGGHSVTAAVWRLRVGKVPLFLLDTNLPVNLPEDREVTARLYGGDNEMRIRQEIVLGVGGVRALREMGLNPSACHMNEGHSSMLGLERIRTLMEERGLTFAQARLPVSAATAFTTHTAVAAGIDLFPAELVRRYLGDYANELGVDQRDLIGLGRTNPGDENEPFSMAMLGLRLSTFRNGVSKLHGSVSRKLWESAWPTLPVEQIPIESVTNGVHLPTWVSHEMGDLYDRHVGPDWREDPANAEWSGLGDVPDEELWRIHERQREQLVHRVRDLRGEALMSRGLSRHTGPAGEPLETRALTIGFARRFAGYKRATLLFRDPERLAAIVNNPERPVQFIFAGKAHPRDEPAKALIREVVELSARPEFRDRLILLEGHDLELARALVQGCDIWLNTPLRPLEASGTSGMKACANGAIHVSVLDGWWWEAYRPECGWAVGWAKLDDDPEAQDAFDAESIYSLLEGEVTDAFYDRDGDGVPREWVAKMRASIQAYAPAFNTSRMVAEYAERGYAPSIERWHALQASGAEASKELARWLERVKAGWPNVKIHDVTCARGEGPGVTVSIQLHPGDLSETDLRVDAVFGRAEGDGDLTPAGSAPLELVSRGEDGVLLFRGEVRFRGGGRHGVAARVLPFHANLHDPFAPGLAHWA